MQGPNQLSAVNNACETAPTADIYWSGGQADIAMPTTNNPYIWTANQSQGTVTWLQAP